MNPKIFHAVCLMLLFFAAALTLPAQTAETAEKTKIDALISHIEGLEGATFIRNGSNYDASSAAKFLRAKWKKEDNKVKTAADFITHVASVSGTSGKPYVIRFKDGKELPCGDYLAARLKSQ